MYKLYHCRSARSFRPLWALEEAGVPYELVMLPFPPRVFKKDYLAINPLGTIPTFFDGTMRMTESAAICQYIAVRADASPMALRPDEAEYGLWLNWLHFGEATLTFPQTLVLRYTILEPEDKRQPTVAADYRKWFLGRLRGIEAALEGRDFLVGGRFTVADISVGYALMLAEKLDINADFAPRVADYWERLKTVPSYGRSLDAQDRALQEQKVDPGQSTSLRKSKVAG